jgi:formylglycine-generating enzyme required for sulfatase activity
MGVVYVARHELLGKYAAVKTLLPDYSQNAEIVQRFFNEARAATQIRHPGIVEVFDFGYHTDGSAFLFMELLQGEPLSARLKRAGRLDVASSVRLLQQMASALGAAHGAGIVHRDLKPDNVFLVSDPDMTGGERVKLLDFGIAKLTNDMGTARTHSGAIMGTPRYMAPEQCRGAREVDHRADLYALGCMAYEMLCGRVPFEEKGVGELLAAHMLTPPVPPSTINESVNPALERVILRLLAKEPDQRYQTAQEVIDALGQAMGTPPRPRAPSAHDSMGAPVATGHGTTLSALSGAAVPAPRRRHAWLWIAVVSLAALSGIGAALVSMSTIGRSTASTQPVDTPAAAMEAPAAPPDAQRPGPAQNPWIKVLPPTKQVLIGLSSETVRASPDAIGLRAERHVTAPASEYEIQQHEVTWSELDPWLSHNPGLEVLPAAWVPADPAMRRMWAATGIPWDTARAYCRSIGGRLPTEAEWEYAARGSERRPSAWGADTLDIERTNAYRGAKARMSEVMSHEQDRTPGPAAEAIFDMMGNGQEWTADLWRNDRPGEDESWVQTSDAAFRTIKGLPVQEPLPARLPVEPAAYRDVLCSTESCLAESPGVLAYQGFRCVRDSGRRPEDMP